MKRSRKAALSLALVTLPLAASACTVDVAGGTLHFPFFVDGFINRFNPECSGVAPLVVWCPPGVSPSY